MTSAENFIFKSRFSPAAEGRSRERMRKTGGKINSKQKIIREMSDIDDNLERRAFSAEWETKKFCP